MNVCDCNAGLSNTGLPGCVPIQGITSSLILVPLKDSAGVKNGIDLTAPLPTWSDLVNEADSSKRWFPLPEFENVELPKADTLTEEAASGRLARLRQGKRSYSGELWEEASSPQLLGKLENARCVDFGIMIVDVNGDLTGAIDGDFLRPIPVDSASWDPVYMFPTDTTVGKIVIGFDFNRLFDESTMKLLTAAEAGQNFTELEGLMDVIFPLASIVSLPVLTGFNATLCYGTALNPIKYKGAILTADWSIFNNTTQLPVTVDSVTEGPDGSYVLNHAAGIVATNSYTVSVARLGFEGSFTAIA